MSLVHGTRFGPCEVVGSLGTGGMGEVNRGDTKLDRDAALVRRMSLRGNCQAITKLVQTAIHPLRVLIIDLLLNL